MLDLGGTYRTLSPQDTLAKVRPLLWEKFGITRVANITGLDNVGIPTYMAIRPYAKLLTTAQGKGITHELAQISAIMESIEGWHCENMPPPALFGSYNALSSKYHLANLNPTINHGPFEWRDIENLEIPWGQGIELHTGSAIYFPYTTLTVDTTYFRPGYRYFPPTTNGLASGNTYEEAICHALLEVLEREFEAAQPTIAQTQQVDLSTIHSSHLRDLLAKIEHSQLRLEVWDMTTDMEIPAFLAIVHDPDDLRSVGMQLGTGAHFSSVVALSRAITEAIQGRVTIISGSRDDQTPRLYKKFKINKPLVLQLFAASKQQPHPFKETTVPANFIACLELLLAKLKQKGYHQVIVYDHTRPELNIPVVHVMVPGLRYLHGTCFACPVSLP